MPWKGCASRWTRALVEPRIVLRAPVLIHRSGARSGGSPPPVLLLEATSAAHAPSRACSTWVRDVGRLCASASLGLAAHGHEYPYESYLLEEPDRPLPPREIEGRSGALAMALASLAHWYALPLRCPVIATGDLSLTDPGRIAPVDGLLEKVVAACRTLRAEGTGGLVLVPHCQRDVKQQIEQVSGVRIEFVATLAEAANLALSTPDGHIFEVSHRADIDRLRLDEERTHDLLRCCERLADEADRFSGAPYGWMLRYQALNNAQFAVDKLARRGLEASWRDLSSQPATRLRATLETALRQMENAVPPSGIPPEFRAERANFRAVHVGYGELNFAKAIRIAGDALRLEGLVAGHHSEHRRLLGTRGQFALRMGLRVLGAGLRAEAIDLVEQALDDLVSSLQDAARPGVTDRNDRARVLVYHGSARVVEEVIRAEPFDDRAAAEADEQRWGLVLGRFLDGDAAPLQDPRWALSFLYGSWLHRGWSHRVIDHFTRVGALLVPNMGDDPAPAPTLATVLLGPLSPPERLRWGLPCDRRIVGALAEAALATGDEDLFACCCEMGPRSTAECEVLPLSVLATWWPTVDVECEPGRLIRRWAADELAVELPDAARDAPAVMVPLEALRTALRTHDLCAAHRARRQLLLWLGDVPPARYPSIPDDYPIFVATRPEQVPAHCRRFLSVDGSVPGHAARFDHHVTGERINLDAMPGRLSPARFDGVGTTLADADAVASVVVFLLGGTAQVPGHSLAVLESASWWCDHLGPHPGHDAETNRLGRGLLDDIAARLADGPREDVSSRFAAVCRDLASRLRRGEPLPMRDTWSQQLQVAARLDAEGRISRCGPLALVDLRGAPSLDPLATYTRHDRPVAVLVDEHPSGGARYTVGVNPNLATAPSDLSAALRALAAAEFAHGLPTLAADPVPGAENWGGRATVFGSPWNYASRLSPEEVVAIAATALGLSTG